MKKNIIFLLLAIALSAPSWAIVSDKNIGMRQNLVCFVRFSDEPEQPFLHSGSFYEQLFNEANTDANSVYQYFYQSSYGQLQWKSTLFPSVPSDDKIVSLRLSTPRTYYQPYSEQSNPDGYKDALTAISREQGMVKELVTLLSEQLPADVATDGNQDGIVDNLCIIIDGCSGIGSSYLLWPHRSMLQLSNVPMVQGKKVTEYLMLFDEANGYQSLNPIAINTGVICHEMSHALGTYDLYHAQKGLSPVGVWDLMSDNLLIPQQMSAFTKSKYLQWIDDIPQISQPGVYTLNPIGGISSKQLAYKIKPTGSDEYFVVEYRRNVGTFEQGLPGSGLLVYRISPHASGNLNYNGVDRFDEIYIFRPGGTVSSDGELKNAFFSQESGRTAFGGSAAMKPFYTDGREAKFALTNISACGETLSFELLPMEPQIYLPSAEASLAGSAGSSVQITLESDIAWEVSALPDWLTVSSSKGDAGIASLQIAAKSRNESTEKRIGKVIFRGVDNPTVADTALITQSSDLIQAPTGLAAMTEEASVVLTWKAPHEGSPLLSDGFEDNANPNNWILKNEHQSGWNWCANAKSTPAYDGNYSMRAKDDWDELHQDEWLISPEFAQGKTLCFYSKSTAVGKNNLYNFYYVEVSADGGLTWQPIWDLMKNGTLVNQYERVEVDLSSFASDHMKIAFHAYDTNVAGHTYLSYPWFVDEVTIYPIVAQSQITGYRIYRDGALIGTSSSCSFTDVHLKEGTACYQVTAVGSFGETMLSTSVDFTYEGSTGISPFGQQLVSVWKEKDRIGYTLSGSDAPIQIQVLTATGTLLWSGKPAQPLLPGVFSQGVYLVRMVFANGKIVTYKVM